MLVSRDNYLMIVYSLQEEISAHILEELNKKKLKFAKVSSYQSLMKEIEEADNYIIIADYLIPSFNGQDLLAKLDGDFGSVPPIMFILSYSESDVLYELTNMGVRDFLFTDDHFELSVGMRLELLMCQLEREKNQKKTIEGELSGHDVNHFMDSLADMIFIKDMDDNIIDVNNSCVERLGFCKKELLKKKPAQLISPQEVFNYHLEKRLLNKTGQHIYETTLLTKEYHAIPVEVSSKLTTYKGKDAVISIARDIGNRLETKEKLKTLNQDLERIKQEYRLQNDRLRLINREVEESRHALKLALQEAENAEKLKNKFLANMSHEIRTPMNAVVGFSQLLEDADPEDVPEFVRIINNNAETLLQLINDLMDIAKIESDLVSINTEKLSLHELLLDIESIMKYEKKNKGKGHIFVKYYSNKSKDCIIETDKLRLKQILINLLNNALKFTEEGTIEFGFTKEENQVNIYVKDSGIGIPIKMQQQIFERFRQIDHIEKPQGTGIGLSISRSLIQLLGGDITLESNVNRGSVFHVVHPISQDKNARVKPPVKNVVLIAEDEEDNFHLLKYIVKDLNLDVIWAKDGREAVSYCQEKPVCLVLMDIKMPSMDGLDATKEILKINPNIPIIAQTAYTQEDDILKCKQAGCVEFVPKPINLTILRRTISKYI